MATKNKKFIEENLKKHIKWGYIDKKLKKN